MLPSAMTAQERLPEAKEEMDFLDSSFFKTNAPNPRLPTPAEVRALSTGHASRPFPVRFESLGLLVKFGPNISVAEAQCLWLVKETLGDELPVPEVYGWRVDGTDVFIYMELIHGKTLEEQWDSLSETEKTDICSQLRKMIMALRQVRHSSSDPFIGSIDRHALLDYTFEGQGPAGPFASVKIFHDWFSKLPQKWVSAPPIFEDPWRPYLPDTAEIIFTHSDLHRRNILISSTTPPLVVAIVDWGQAGWYPDYWEYCKAAYTALSSGEWRQKWIPMFLSPREDEEWVFSEYTTAIGAV